MKSAKSQVDEITFSRSMSPVAIYFSVVSLLILVMIGMAVMAHDFPVPLLGLLAIVGLCCLLWLKETITELGNVTIELTNEELRVKRLLGSSSYSWSFIEEVKLFDPGPTLADSGRHEEVRAGLGLNLKNGAKERDSDAPPDVLLIAGSRDLAEPIVRASQRLTAFHRRVSTPANRRSAGTATSPGFNKSRKQFRRPVASAAG